MIRIVDARRTLSLWSLVGAAVVVLVVVAAGDARAVDPKVKDLVKIIDDNEREVFEQRKRERAIRDLGKIGGAEAAAALVKIFEDPFIHLHDRAVSAWIQMLRGDNAADTRAFLTKRALRHRRPEVRHGAAAALGVTGGVELETVFAQAVKNEKHPRVLAALAEAAVRLQGEPSLQGVFLPKLKHKDGQAVLRVSAAVARYDKQSGVKALVTTLKHRSPIARAGAVYALQQLDALPPDSIDGIYADKHHAPPMALAESLEFRTQALPWPGRAETTLERLLGHASWRVRAAAIQGALRLWDKGIVEPLIARLGAEKGRLQNDVRRALETYTGQALGEDPDLWTAWWRQKKQAFDAGQRPRPDRADNIRFREASGHDKGEGTRTVAFFNMPLRSLKLAFVFDLSGSMRNVAKKGAKEGVTKVELLREEMEKTLRGLTSEARIDILVYRYWSEYPPLTKLTRALGKLSPCSKGNLRKAVAWLNKQEAKGWGAFYEPLEALWGEDVDTVVLLSDGVPSRGRYDRDDRFLDEFSRANRFHRVAVNTVLIGTKGADRRFMQELAAATGGRVQEAGGK